MKRFIVFIITAIILAVSAISCDTAEKKAEKMRIAAENARKEYVRDSIARVEFEKAKREKEIADSVARENHLNEVKNSIRLTSYWLSGANSAGGRDIHFNYQNLSKTKTIKYLVFSVTFYNAVGDLAYDEIRDYCHYNGKDTGPIKPMGYGSDGYWECAIYNYQAKKMVLNSINIEYTDGTELYINGEDLKLIKGYKG